MIQRRRLAWHAEISGQTGNSARCTLTNLVPAFRQRLVTLTG